jgi:hypothetical protein
MDAVNKPSGSSSFKIDDQKERDEIFRNSKLLNNELSASNAMGIP